MAEKRILRFFEIVFFVMIALVLLVNVLLDNRVYYLYQNKCPVPNFVFFGLVLVLFCVFVYISKKKMTGPSQEDEETAVADRSVMKYVFGLSVIFFVFQIVFAYEIYFETGWDCREIVTMAQRICFDGAKIGDAHYFSLYPNNVFLTGIFAAVLWVFKVCGIKSAYFPLIVVGALVVNATGWFFADCVRVLTGKRKTVIVFWLLFMFLTGLSPWISIPYSDTYSVFFPTFAIWIYLKKHEKNNAHIWFLVTLVCFVGYFIKPTVILTLFAIVLIEAVHYLAVIKDHDAKDNIRKFAAFALPVLGAVVLALLMRFSMEKITGFTPDKTRSVTPVHYFMMGLNRESTGGYNQADVNRSFAYADVSERNREDLKEAFRRIDEMMPFAVVKFTAQKMLNNFNDGTFAWGHEGDFYWTYFDKENGLAKAIRSFVYHIGSRHGVYVAFAQCLWICVLSMCALYVIKPGEDHDRRKSAVMMSMLAIMCFLMLFEARARYLYLYSPVIYMTAALGVERLNLRKESGK